MNFKKSWKRANEGFTLVELIVVIAILAILAGVAVPAYSGYIKKANKAADLQLLNAVNTAFAASCLENGKDANQVTRANISLTGEVGAKRISGISVEGAAEPYTTSFNKYFAGNTGTFKVITSLIFQNGVFVESEANQYSYGGGTVSLSQNDINNVVNSTYGTVGIDKLMNQVDFVAGNASQFIVDGGTLGDLVLSPAYLENLANTLGMSGEELEAELEARNEAGTLQQYLANSVVLSVAQNASTSLDRDTMSTMLTEGTIQSVISANMGEGGDATLGLSQAALAYGMYTAYANNSGNQELINKAESISDVTDLKDILGDLKSDEFKTYMAGQGQADLDAYLSAMNMISDSASDPNAAQSVLNNGFADQALVDLMMQATGAK